MPEAGTQAGDNVAMQHPHEGVSSFSGNRRVVAVVALALAYYATAELGLALTLSPIPVSTLWLPNAVLFAAFLLTPARSWWILAVAVLPAHLAAELRVEIPLAMALCWYVSNVAEALLGATLLTRLFGRPFRLDSFAAVGGFVVFGVIIPAALSSFVDAAFVRLNDWGDAGYWRVWETRLRSNTLAGLTVAPVIVSWFQLPWREVGSTPRRRLLEGMVLAAAVLAVSVAAFGGAGGERLATPALVYMPLPVLLWAAVRFGPAGISASMLVVVLLAVWNAAHGRGPFLSHSADANALAMQVLFGSTSAAMLSLAAVIEERRRTLEVVRLRREQLQLALDGAQMGIWLYRIYTEILELSPEAARIFALHDGDVLLPLRRFLTLIHPSDRRMMAAALRQAALAGAPFEVEVRVVGAGRAPRWVLAKGRLLHDASGKPARLVGVCADVSARKQAEAIRAAHHHILEMITMGFSLQAVLDEAVAVVEAESPGMLCSVLLLDDDGLHARHVSAPHLPSEYVQAIDGVAIGPSSGAFGAAMYMRRPVFSPNTLTDPRWRRFRALVREHGLKACCASPILTEGDQVCGAVVGYFRESRHPTRADVRALDLTTRFCAIVVERKRREAQAHQRERELAHLSRVVMLGELSGAIAHEINQPLAAIMSQAQAGLRLLTRGDESIPEVGEVLRDIIDADRRAASVIERLRSMMKSEEGTHVETDLNDVVTTAVGVARRDLQERGIRVELRLSHTLPSVLGDRVQLQQVVLNLVLNAGDAMSSVPPQQRRLIVATRSGAGDTVAQISVTDRGPGIDVFPIERIFEPFFTRKERGLGLGLAICRSIAAAHQGRLWAENDAHGGASFHLSLPAISPAEEPGALVLEGPASTAEERVSRG